MNLLSKRLIVVLGMHRSGTSTITRALTTIGVSLGDSLMPAVEGNNPKGFFEDADISALNNEMLKAISSEWHYLALIEPRDIDLLHEKGYFNRAVVLLNQKTANYSIFGFKDPRVAKLLAFWQPVFIHCGFTVDYILAIRNPLSVMQSIVKRDGISPEKSYLLWLQHVLNSLLYTQDYKHIIVDYDHFLSAPKHNLEILAKHLDLTINKDALHIFETEFIDLSLRHTNFELINLNSDQACPPLAKEVYAEILNSSHDISSMGHKKLQSLIASWNSEFNRLQSNFRLVDNLTIQNTMLISQPDKIITDIIKDTLNHYPSAIERTFDTQWYLNKYPDLNNVSIDPFQHYVNHGVFEGRVPSDDMVAFLRNALFSHINQLDIKLDSTEKLVESQLVDQANHEKITTQQILELKQTHERKKIEQSLNCSEHKPAYLAQLTQARQQIKTQLIELANREKAASSQLQNMQQAHEQQKGAQSREHAKREHAFNAQLNIKQDELQSLKNRWTQSEQSLALTTMQLREELNAIRSTYIWRWTAPLRGLADALGRSGSRSLTSASAATTDELMSHNDEHFIHSAYHAVLGWVPDSKQLHHRLSCLRSGISKIELLAKLWPVKVANVKKENTNLSDAIKKGFDEKFYMLQNPDIVASGTDPYKHYINYGKAEGRLGLPPELKVKTEQKNPNASDDFDAEFYTRHYPDILSAGVNPRDHYINHGKEEGRLGRLPELPITKGAKKFDESKETVLVVCHEASRTGAPILGLNITRQLQNKFNVISMLLGGGPIVDDFINESTYVVGPMKFDGNYSWAGLIIEQLQKQYPIKFAIANSIESRIVLEGLAKQHIPTITLIHEFASYTRPKNAFHQMFQWTSNTVFSTRITHENAVSECPEFANIPVHIIPQGRSALISGADSEDATSKKENDPKVLKILHPNGTSDNTVVILGAGTVQYRKGVDLFVDCAAKVVQAANGAPCRFVWIGKGYDPEHDLGYSTYLADQVRRAKLEKHVFFMDETPNIETAYKTADILLLSSRLDPLPNVAIDAMSHGMPVVCFENTTGIADTLHDNGLGKECVAPYLDTEKMAELILALIKSQNLRNKIGQKLRQVERKYFSMERYVDQLEALAKSAVNKLEQEQLNFDKIIKSNIAQMGFFLPPHLKNQPANEAIRFGYIRSWVIGIGRRKLFPGFQPNIYQEHQALPIEADPLVHYLQSDKPEGAWYNGVINSDEMPLPTPANTRIALHLHVYYADLLSEMLTRLNMNKVRPDLLISVPSELVQDEVNTVLELYSGKVIEVQIVPNRGRDIGPLLTGFRQKLIDNYDIVGHLHTKKTVGLADSNVGRVWYLFLLENLLGGKAKMADVILGKMAGDKTIGMVFPDDPNVVGWGINKPYAKGFMGKLGLSTLPDNFVFPVGTMFWARVQAIGPLLDLDLAWQDYPEEPLPYDGSILHALERLLPLAMPNKFQTILTNVHNVTR